MKILKSACITCHCSAFGSEKELTEDTNLWWRLANVTIHRSSKIYVKV